MLTFPFGASRMSALDLDSANGPTNAFRFSSRETKPSIAGASVQHAFEDLD